MSSSARIIYFILHHNTKATRTRSNLARVFNQADHKMTSKSKPTISFTEVDELNNPTSTYIYSAPSPEAPASSLNSKTSEIAGRVDLAHTSPTSSSWSLSSLRTLLIDVFLPAGYPHSVSDDYVPYQIFDSLQAFSSSIAGLLASRAVLQGVGVGSASASPTHALLLHILQDTSGRIATIFFAHRVGTALEPECKMYRFAADIFNDLAMIMDCLSPGIPAGVARVGVLSGAGVLRALCGVAGGCSKASLSAHFSRWGNLAEVNAKDSSQETVISLIGMLVGSLVVSQITSFTATWITLIFLLSLHLSLNYAAVRSVQMTTLNRQRANIVFSMLLASDPNFTSFVSNHDHEGDHKPLKQQAGEEKGRQKISALTLAQVAKQERIFDAGGALRWYPSASSSSSELTARPAAPETLGKCEIGVSLRRFLSCHASATSSGSLRTTLPLEDLTSLFESEEYILLVTPSDRQSHINIQILLKSPSTSSSSQTSGPKSHLKAWMHALLTAKFLRSIQDSSVDKNNEVNILDILARTLTYLNKGRFGAYIAALSAAGWDIDGERGGSALETRAGGRVVISVL
ncbi:RUS1 family protein [Aspergillus undulatus]|uniref:RUS1 family protein n=1 Tax=Aspergillus undulatus TaxID=1810928 RepID=UPI003CCD5B3F